MNTDVKEEIEIIEDYRDELAAPLAEMFNSWDELWPGGFTHGVPYTAERVRKWLSPMRAIAILIAMDREQGKPVGFLSLLSHWRDPEAAYIGLLGVSPEVLGKKFGKHLLLRSLTIATQKGYRRVDLHTWAGNLRAVPLYKKLGFMWNPEGEGVYLQNYIPAILSHPLCAPFFKTHPDWYALQRRELELAPDEMREEGMDLFIYSFVAGEDSLRVLVDRYARGITGVERVLGEERLRIEACLSEHLTICGLPGEYTLRMENGTSEELALTVSLEGFAGLRFDREPEPRLKVPAGGSAALTVPFRLDTSVPLYRKELKCPAIVATLTLEAEGEEQEFALATGLKIKPAAEIHTRFGECRALPGGRTTLPITTMSNLSTALRGKIRFEPPDHPITIAPIEREIELPPEGPAGVTVELALSEELAPGAYDLWAVLQLEKAGGDSDGDGDRDRDEDEDEDLTLTT
ncbi:MAG TPA: GNAT family N-acetyltransferase, partial [Candidatus Latescibacteria bacterium]|nr:GNAT family N-acetyltransferase [Candidatus Latescibacterota bacterium]